MALLWQVAVPPEQLSVSTPLVQPSTVHRRVWVPFPLELQAPHVCPACASVRT